MLVYLRYCAGRRQGTRGSVPWRPCQEVPAAAANLHKKKKKKVPAAAAAGNVLKKKKKSPGCGGSHYVRIRVSGQRGSALKGEQARKGIYYPEAPSIQRLGQSLVSPNPEKHACTHARTHARTTLMVPSHGSLGIAQTAPIQSIFLS